MTNDIFYAMPKRYSTTEGKPLFGKVEFRDPITSNLLDVYSFVKDGEYVITSNPQYTDVYGCIDDTFVLNHLVLVCTYSYIGNLSDPKNDTDATHWLHEYNFFASFDNKVIESADTISTIASLRDADVTQGNVKVVGYHNAYDCQARTYVWDPNCIQDEDGGYIIKSNNQNVGRWLLVWNQEALPSEMYGVYTGKEANLGNLLTYHESVGSYAIPTARMIEFTNFRFASGTNRTLSTDKVVRCSRDCYFGKGNFTVPDVIVDGSYSKADKALGNFVIRDNNNTTKVCISWFSTADQFFHSNANHLVYDVDGGNKADWNTLNNPCYLHNCTLEYLVDTHTMLNASLTLDGVNFIMPTTTYFGVGNTSKITFKNMHVDTRNIREAHIAQFENCTIDVHNLFFYDTIAKSSNYINVASDAEVRANATGIGDEVLDIKWFEHIADGTMMSRLKHHGIASWRHSKVPNNFYNDDFSDVDVIELEGFTGKKFNINANMKSYVTVQHMNDVELYIAGLSSLINVTVKDSPKVIIKTLRKSMMQFLKLNIDNCRLYLETTYSDNVAQNHVETLGTDFYIFNNSVLIDNRSETPIWDSTNKKYLDKFEKVVTNIGNNFMAYDVEIDERNAGTWNIGHTLYFTDSDWSSNSKNNDFKGVNTSVNVGHSINATGSYFKTVWVVHNGEYYKNNTTTAASVRFTGCAFRNSSRGGVSQNDSHANVAYFTMVGNLFDDSSRILFNNTTPYSKVVLDNNIGQSYSTKVDKIFFNNKLAGEIEMSADGNYEHYAETDGIWLHDFKQNNKVIKGRSQEIYEWLTTCYPCTPIKGASESYDDVIKRVNSGDYGIRIKECRKPFAGTATVTGASSTNPKAAYSVDIVVKNTKDVSFA